MPDRWYVVQSIPRMEGWAVENLLAAGFQSYWPRHVVEQKKVVAGERYRSMYPSYLFVNFDVKNDPWRAVCSTRGVKRVLGATEETVVPLPVGFVESMKMAAPDGVIDLPKVNPIVFSPGDALKVIDGPLAGHTGTMQFSEKGRVALLLSLLGRENVVYLPADRVAYAEAPL